MQKLLFSVQPSIVGRDVERLKQKVLKRDDHMCCWCGLSSLNGMSVVYASDEHISNIDGCCTACAICAATLRGGLHGGSNAGYMIFMPEIDQSQVIGLFQAMQAWTFIAVTARQRTLRVISENVEARRGHVEHVIGASKSDYVAYWRKLLSSNSTLNKQRERVLGPFRFMPVESAFHHEIKSWGRDVFLKYDEKSIEQLINNVGVV